MKLTASPFDPQTGELLPVYRDAYLRGDLSKHSARAVETYLRHDGDQAYSTLTRWHEFQAEETAEAAPNWVHKQLLYIRTEPQRFRRRASSLLVGATLVGSMVFAGTNLTGVGPVAEREIIEGASADVVLSAEAEAAATKALRIVTVQGRILDENGKPLAGATVMPKGSRYGTCTNASGTYVLHVPAGEQTLLYGYGGYHDKEVKIQGNSTEVVALQPHEQAKKRWWQIF